MDTALRVVDLRKRFQLGAREAAYGTFRDALGGFVSGLFRGSNRQTQSETLWALDGVSFEVPRGQVMGVIGPNGAGKSTLLKILSRVTEPTEGRAEICGSVGSLLEVGTGFHAELTGRENVYLNGAILGMGRAEIARKFDAIVAFSGVERFIDTPVKRFSTGMYLRLAFAVAAHLESDILLVDEVLAVGDAAFQKRCLGKMDDVSKQGRTVLLVSHNLGSIRQLCPRSIWLDSGRIRADGETSHVVDAYIRHLQPTAGASSCFPMDPSKEAQIRSVRVVNQNGDPAARLTCDEPVVVEIGYQVNDPSVGVYACFQVSRTDGTPVLVSYSYDSVPNPLDSGLEPGTHAVRVTIPARTLGHGAYALQLSLGRVGVPKIIDDAGTACVFELDDFTSVKGNLRLGYFSTLLPWEVVSLPRFPSLAESR